MDESGRELLQRGRLSEELEASGFGGSRDGDAVEIEARGEEGEAALPAAQRRREEQLRKLRERVTKAKGDATKAERAAARAEAALGAAHQRLVEANESVRGAGAELRRPDCYSTVTVFARLRGWSTFSPRSRAMRYASSCKAAQGARPAGGGVRGCRDIICVMLDVLVPVGCDRDHLRAARPHLLDVETTFS